MEKPYNLIVSYDHGSRSGDGKKFEDNMYAATLLQKLTDERSQYFMAAYDKANVGFDSHEDTSTGAVAYGQIWKGANPGLTYNLGGYFSKSYNDYGNAAVSGESYVHSGSAGITGGAQQVLPLNAEYALTLGANFSLFYQLVDDTPGHEHGTNATIYPFLQISHAFTPEFSGYARFTAIGSTADVDLTGSGIMYVP